MEYNSYTKVMFVNLPKNYLFGAKEILAQFRPKLCNLVPHDFLLICNFVRFTYISKWIRKVCLSILFTIITYRPLEIV